MSEQEEGLVHISSLLGASSAEFDFVIVVQNDECTLPVERWGGLDFHALLLRCAVTYLKKSLSLLYGVVFSREQ